jgi:hypothetical protein
MEIYISKKVLLQDGHPLAYVSKPLGPKTQGLSIYEKEYLAILIAVGLLFAIG